jgi:phage N-6-adenine-methyltransferase
MTRQLNAMHTGPRREDWETPPDLFAEYDAEFGFTLDAAANAENAKCPAYLSENALALRWPGVVWLNPPYGKTIGSWVQKAHQEAYRGSTVVCLVQERHAP